MILIIHLLILLQTIRNSSPTVDEVSHLPAGLSHWRFGRFDLYRVNPPFVSLVASVPLLFCDFKEDWSQYSFQKNKRLEFSVGKRFVDLNGADSIRLYHYGRLACVPFSLIGAVSVYWLARNLYEPASGVVAMCLWCFSPNVLGNAAIITPDVAGGALAILAALAFWKWLDSPNWGRTVAAGLALGLAELAKTTCVILYVVWPVMWVVWRWRCGRTKQEENSRVGDTGNIGQLIVIFMLGVYVTNLGYLFDGSFQQLKDYQFVSHALGGPTASHAEPNNRFRDSMLGYIPVPFPVDYIHGIDLQKLDFEGERWSYAGGVHQKRGWWWWYFYAMAVKVPHGTMIIVVMAGIASWDRLPACRMLRKRTGILEENEEEEGRLEAYPTKDWLLLIPAVCILVLVSSQTGFSRYFRYLLPAFPFVFVWASRVAQPHLLRSRWWKGLVAFALLWNVWSCLKVHPHHLAFFNEASGGSDNGHWHLLDANVDWGQANLALKHWVDERAEQVGRREPVYLSCFGVDMGMKLEDLGLNGKPVPMKLDPETQMNKSLPISELPPGLYAISVNHLHGYRHHQAGEPDCSEFLQLKPIAIVGSAIQIFQLPADSQSERF